MMRRNNTPDNTNQVIGAWLALNAIFFVFGLIANSRPSPDPFAYDYDSYARGSSPYGWSPVTSTLPPMIFFNVLGGCLYFAIQCCCDFARQPAAAAVVPPHRPEVPPAGVGDRATLYPRASIGNGSSDSSGTSTARLESYSVEQNEGPRH